MPSPQINEVVAVDGAPAVFAGAGDDLQGAVSLAVPEGGLAVLSLYGQLVVNPSTTVLDRVVDGVEWGAALRRAISGQGQVQPYALDGGDGSNGRLRWTYQDGTRPVARVLVQGPCVFRFGAVQTAAVPVTVTAVACALRGVLLPASDAALAEALRLIAIGS